MMTAIRARESELAALKLGLDVRTEAGTVVAVQLAKPSRWRFLFAPSDEFDPADLTDARRRAEALADTEYAVRAERAVSGLFGVWRIIHIATGTLLYALLLLHIWAGYYFGFRWL